MGIAGGPNIISDDLALLYDCADINCYAGEPTVNIINEPNNLTDSGVWNVTNGTLAINQIDGPNDRKAGSLTATNSDPYIYSSYIFTVTTDPLTFSAWVKGTGATVGMGGDIRINFGTSGGQATGTNATSNYTITSDWQRVSVTATPTGAGTIKVGIEIPNSATSGQVAYIADPQLEQKSYATPFANLSRPEGVDFLLSAHRGLSDSGPNNLTITNLNGISLGGPGVFGGSAVKFTGGQELTTASTNVINFGTGDWTIDFWFNITNGSTARMHAVSCGGGNTNNIDFNFNDASAFWLYFNGSGGNKIQFGSDGDYGDGQWHHLMCTRKSGMLRVWVDGVHKGSNNYSSSTSMGQTASIYVGGKGGVYWNGYLDDIRIIKGTAIWSGGGNFPKPTSRHKAGILNDLSRNNNDGFSNSTIETAAAHYRKGAVVLPTENRYLDFNGSDDFITTSFGSGRNPYSSPTTFVAWVKSDSTLATRMWLDHGSNGSNQRLYCALITADNPNIFGIQSQGWGYSSNADNSKWYHQALVMDSGTARAYYDGIAAGTKSYTSYTLPGNTRAGGRSSYLWDGQIACFAIYDRALSAAEIKQNFKAQRGRFGI